MLYLGQYHAFYLLHIVTLQSCISWRTRSITVVMFKQNFSVGRTMALWCNILMAHWQLPLQCNWLHNIHNVKCMCVCDLLLSTVVTKQCVALMGRKHTGPPCSVGHPTTPCPSAGPAAADRPRAWPAGSITDNDRWQTTTDRHQWAKPYWPIRRASNNSEAI